MKTLVIGAGSIGANVAYRLAEAGHQTIVVDAGQPAGGTSGASISWLSNFPQVAGASPDDLRLRLRINDLFRDLQAEIGGDWLHWTGTLTWASDPDSQARLRQDQRRAAQLGVKVDLLTGPQAERIDSSLRLPSHTEVFHEDDGGWVDAPRMIERLLAAAQEHGATVMADTRIEQIQRTDRVVAARTDTGVWIDAEAIVVAAGSNATHIASMAGCAVPLDLRPGLVVYATPNDGVELRHVLDTPMMNIRPHPGGGVAIHWRGESLYGHHSFNALDPQEVVDAAARWIPALRGVTASSSRIGIRPVPPGGPVIGEHPALKRFYLAVSHGGIGWGPLWGLLIRRELDGENVAEIDAMRPSRFFASPHHLVE